ncbi:Glycoside hydrolase family 15 protein [Mycena indigotica]|uniref:glucan 1,4-alpha-glucosidase n=1 Tax=Mycena indigotica TaxID=2126181 RepID=A0A8H6TEF1_9AGAR|nr:Glycoside hydrolase family 15 protein [Mycena indigotica]KAF7315221.1 Glycoside hydrolase family 15 protein [Mycena indigotica]
MPTGYKAAMRFIPFYWLGLFAVARATASADSYLDAMLANIGPKASGVPAGIVIASPSKNNPDYFYTWTRDSSLVFKAVVDRYSIGDRAELQTLIEQFIQVEEKLQSVSNPSGTISSGGLGEPKFNVDLTAFTGAWGRPQRDGPALRAIAVMTYASIHTTNASFWPMVKADLDYVMADWNLSTFDLWEEVNSSGSFFTSAVQHRALRQGAGFAKSLGLTSVAAAYITAADSILCLMQSYWSNSGYIMANKGGGRSGKDANTVLASIHTFDAAAGCDPLTFQPCSDKSLANLKVYADAFRNIYPINTGNAPNAAVATGRYPEDGYMGGNPWYLTTFAVAEQLYRALGVWKAQGSLTVTSISLAFFRQFAPDVAVGTYTTDSTVFATLTQAVTSYADGFMAVNDKYTPGNGGLSEQYSRSNGSPVSASSLTWSYAAALTALNAKNGQLSASSKWGGDGLTLPRGCSSTGGGGGGGSGPTVNVVFDLNVEASQGDTVYVVGSPAELMRWDTNNAIPLSPINSTAESVTIAFPANTSGEYKYLQKANGDSTVQWENGPNRVFNSGNGTTLHDVWSSGGGGGGSNGAAINVTFHEMVSVNAGGKPSRFLEEFHHEYVLPEQVYIVGSISQLKNWNTNDAVALSVSNDVWSVTIELPANTKNIQYKYIRKSTHVVWESDPNRQISTGNSPMTENDTWR